MKPKLLLGLLCSLVALTLTACGGGGGGGGGGSEPTTVVSGTVTKGLVSGATVKVFQIISSHNPNKARVGTTVLGQQPATLADGSYSINIGNVTRGALLVQATGGSYRDEATGVANTPFIGTINAVFGNISGIVRRGQAVTVNVTPLTELGFRALPVVDNRPAPSEANIAAANAKVSSTLGLDGVNVVTTKPVTADVTAPQGTTAAQIEYGRALAVVSQMMKDGKTLTEIVNQFAPDIRAGVLSADNAAAGQAAQLNFLNSPFNKTGAAPGLTVAVAASRNLLINNGTDKSVISATVQQDGQNVANGTLVTFVVKSGSGTLSAASVPTANGVASVDLTGTGATGSSVVITAQAGGVSDDSLPVGFIDQPSQATVTVSLTGTLQGSSLIGGADARIAFALNKGLSAPTAAVIGIGIDSTPGVPDIVITNNTTINPTITQAAWANGTQPGNLVRLTFPVALGNLPSAADFTVDAASRVFDLNGVNLAGTISVSITDFQLQ